ncbi:MAG TPA: phage holin family protein [Stellaceae bacterium]|jgi:uncharacterized membrane protein YqjE|nr:phage holin family protein [Stellaceae bacterium]
MSDHADDHAGDPGRGPDRASLTMLFGLIVKLLLQHWNLATAEWADSAGRLGTAALFAVIAVLLGFVALILLFAGGALALALVMPLWAAFLAVGGAMILAAIVLLLLARAQSRRCTLVPHRALASLSRQASELGGDWR